MTHPERLAQTIAAARGAGRFYVPINDPTGLDAPRTTYWRVMQPIIAAASSCRLFDLPRKERQHMAPTTPSPAYHRYLERSSGRTEVAMKETGVREDVDFWWALVDSEMKRPIFTVPLSLVDSASLFSSGDGAVFATLRYDLPSSAIPFAKSQVAAGDAVCLLPIVQGAVRQAEVFRLVVFAAPDVAATLSRDSLEHAANADLPHELDRDAAVDRGFPPYVFDASQLSYDLSAGDPERRLKTLLGGVAKRGDSASIHKALAAAEVVAAMEKRPAEQDAEWTGYKLDAANTLRKWAAEQDLLSAETVALAQATVASIAPERATDPTILSTEFRESMADNWRLWLSDLAKRLDAAVLARRVRAVSPNAAPPVLTRKSRAQLASPEAWKSFYFYALLEDALALLDFVREETGGHLITGMSDGSIREWTSSWDCRQALSQAFDGHFDDRQTSVRADHRSGIKFQIWWPEVSPPPSVREQPPPDDPEGEEMVRELLVDPAPRQAHATAVVGWGIAAFLFRGGKVGETARDGILTEYHLVLRSVFEYPTGTELRRPRYKTKGPWSEVDWKALRQRIREVRAHITGPLSSGTSPAAGREPILRHAAIRCKEGWKLANKYATPIRPRDGTIDPD